MTRDVSDITYQKRGLRFEKSQLRLRPGQGQTNLWATDAAHDEGQMEKSA